MHKVNKNLLCFIKHRRKSGAINLFIFIFMTLIVVANAKCFFSLSTLCSQMRDHNHDNYVMISLNERLLSVVVLCVFIRDLQLGQQQKRSKLIVLKLLIHENRSYKMFYDFSSSRSRRLICCHDERIFGGEFYDRLRGNNHQRLQSVWESRKLARRVYQDAFWHSTRKSSENLSIIMCLSVYLRRLSDSLKGHKIRDFIQTSCAIKIFPMKLDW